LASCVAMGDGDVKTLPTTKRSCFKRRG